jgi:glycerol uptake facilitator-like aquaporin
MKKYLVEFIGTFFLVTAVGMTGNPLAIGAMLMIMVYFGGHISGAHYNPAVTLAVMVRGKIKMNEAMVYWLVQLLGAIAAAFFCMELKGGETFACKPMPGINILKPLIAEIVFTFALASVVLNVATHSKTAGNSYYGLAIGFTVLASAYCVGAISGGAFNPAVGCGPIIVDTINHGDSMKNIWIYIVGPLAGGAIAGIIFKFINPEE